MSSSKVIEQPHRTPGLISVSDQTPPIILPTDAEVDLEILRSLPKQFCVGDEKSVNWVLKRIMAARQYSQHVKVWAEHELNRAQREEQCLMFLFGRQIEVWVKGEIVNLNGKRKSLALPAGTVGYRTVAAKLVIDDEKLVLSWAKEHCHTAVVVTEKVSKTAIDEYVTATGHVPDAGAHIEKSTERFFIK